MTTLTIERYKILRDMNISPCQVREKIEEIWRSTDFSIMGLINVVIGIVVWSTINNLIDKLTLRGELWIVSPSGKTTSHLPIETALRVIRKQGWTLAIVEPVRPIRRVSRWEALAILVRGDNGY